jgi:hypothetical protein
MNEVNPKRSKRPETLLMTLLESDDRDTATVERLRTLRIIVSRKEKKKERQLLAENAELKRRVAELEEKLKAGAGTRPPETADMKTRVEWMLQQQERQRQGK